MQLNDNGSIGLICDDELLLLARVDEHSAEIDRFLVDADHFELIRT